LYPDKNLEFKGYTTHYINSEVRQFSFYFCRSATDFWDISIRFSSFMLSFTTSIHCKHNEEHGSCRSCSYV